MGNPQRMQEKRLRLTHWAAMKLAEAFIAGNDSIRTCVAEGKRFNPDASREPMP